MAAKAKTSAAKKAVKAPARKVAKPAKASKTAAAKKKAGKAIGKPTPKKIASAKAPKKAPAKAVNVKGAPVKAPAAKVVPSKGKGKAMRAAAPAPAPVGVAVPAVRPQPIAPKAQPPVSPKDVAAAHEYLLTRSAGRSEAPVIVNGRKLPTEEELLRMADADYMNVAQLAFFKHRLQMMEKELLSNAGETTEHLRETVIVPDPADRATIEEEHALELRTRDRERKLLKKVQSSLAHIEAGDYGFCEETGEPIGIPRLLARPTATLSLEAQQRRELKQKLFGD